MNHNSLPAKPTSKPKRLHPVSLIRTTIDDAFWTPKLETLRTVTVNDVFTKFERDGAFANFDRVAQGQKGGHCGSPFWDGLIYETLRAAADFLAVYYDPQLQTRLEGYIARIASAQAVDPDGYINTFVTLMCPEKRWGANGGDQLWSHEEYDAGCLVEAAVHYYRATHKTNLLEIALGFANYMCDYIGPAPKHNIVPSHSLPEEAFVELYRLLRDEPELRKRLSLTVDPKQYLDLVRFWMDNRGNHKGRINFTEYAQDHLGLVEQEEAVGHAVRGTLLYTGLAAFADEVGEEPYYEACQRLWTDVTERKMYITGGVGQIHAYEGFGYGYSLPNDGYMETCAGVGMAFWASRMNQAFGVAGAADVYERVIYNNVLAAISLEGDKYAYQNPLQTRGDRHRWEWHQCPCCPPMLLKLYAGLGDQIYAYDGQDMYINQYIGSKSSIPLSSGEVNVTMQTRYPWDGSVRIGLQLTNSKRFGLHFRIPSWCRDYQASINGQREPSVVSAYDYGLLQRKWHDGDIIELELAMPVQRIVAHPFVARLRDQVAIQRGPVVYCLEGIDNPDDDDPILHAHPELRWEYKPDLLGGVVAIACKNENGTELRAIPYFAWDNRSVSDHKRDWMTVWMKQADWYNLRSSLDGGERKGWEHTLYQPLYGKDEEPVPGTI